ncbi:probable pectinesterase 68 [Impatiens glandulifera]|uniref:probable pectinesterase 68 n=1 Tax=Impatiens glandulifera TaxID=253017 RepID=UPI001FB14C0B|nr:probable pectinesterase 68 [Impatiens glandulifera]
MGGKSVDGGEGGLKGFGGRREGGDGGLKKGFGGSWKEGGNGRTGGMREGGEGRTGGMREGGEGRTGGIRDGAGKKGMGGLCVQFFLGQYSRIVYAHTYFDNIVSHGGCDDWDHISNKNKTAFFEVYKCYGFGAKAVRGVSLARELDYELAHPFLAKSFVNGRHLIAPLDA